MPTRKVLCPFEIDPAFDEQADIEKRVQECREFLSRIIEKTNKLSDDIMQCLCMFSMIDCFAQEWAEYPTHDVTNAFCGFIKKFQKRFSYLERIEPITLYYRVEEMIPQKPPVAGMNPAPIIDIEDLSVSDSFLDVLNSEFSDRLLKYIQANLESQKYEKLSREHTLLRLLYQMRNKVVHELSGLGSEYSWERKQNNVEPYYREMGRSYIIDGNIVSDTVFELVFPVPFIRAVTEDCIHNYLDFCIANHRYPFSKEWPTRSMTTCWYDNIVGFDGSFHY